MYRAKGVRFVRASELPVLRQCSFTPSREHDTDATFYETLPFDPHLDYGKIFTLLIPDLEVIKHFKLNLPFDPHLVYGKFSQC